MVGSLRPQTEYARRIGLVNRPRLDLGQTWVRPTHRGAREIHRFGRARSSVRRRPATTMQQCTMRSHVSLVAVFVLAPHCRHPPQAITGRKACRDFVPQDKRRL